MTDIAQCAKCGETGPLCNSVRLDGVKQPRYCKSCVQKKMVIGWGSEDNPYWTNQIYQLDDNESIAKLEEMDDEMSRRARS